MFSLKIRAELWRKFCEGKQRRLGQLKRDRNQRLHNPKDSARSTLTGRDSDDLGEREHVEFVGSKDEKGERVVGGEERQDRRRKISVTNNSAKPIQTV